MNSHSGTDAARTETMSETAKLQKRVEQLISVGFALIAAVLVVAFCIVATAFGIFAPADSFAEWGGAIGLLFALGAIIFHTIKAAKVTAENPESLDDPNYGR